MKRSPLLAMLALGATSAAMAQFQMIADFDNQLLAAKVPVVGSQFMFSTVHTDSSAQNINVGYYLDPTLQTSSIAPTRYNISRVAGASDPLTGPVPAPDTTNACELRWAWMGTGTEGVQRSILPEDTFLRCYYHSSTTLRCPVIDTTKLLKFDIWTKVSQRVAIVVSEIDLTGMVVGASGPTGGPFEAIGGIGDEKLTDWPAKGFGGYIIPAETWTTLTFNLNDLTNHSIRAYVTGNGTLLPTTPDRLTLNSVLFTPLLDHGGDVVSNEVYIDNVRQGEYPVTGIKGNVVLGDFGGDVTQKPVTMEVEDSSATIVQTETVTLAANGDFQFNTTLADGTYSVYAKASTWLRKKLANVQITNMSASGLSFSLDNGDVDGDNSVTVFDYTALSDAFDTVPGDPAWNPNADLDGDDSVTVFDYNILSNNFDMNGD